jgi:hypothetical protein
MASESAAQTPKTKADTNRVRVIRGTTDTAAILQATETGGASAWVFRIVGDTAWVRFKTSRTVRADTVRATPDLLVINENNTWDPWETRVERRAGKWVRISTNARP